MQRQWLHWKNRVLYAANKFQYDTQKKAELLWYGSKNVGSAHANVSVPFMVTRQMKVQLAENGFPSHIVAALAPADAHAILQTNTSFDTYLKQANAPSSTPVRAGPVTADNAAVALATTPSSQHAGHDALAFVPTPQDPVDPHNAEPSVPAAALAIVPDTAPSTSA